MLKYSLIWKNIIFQYYSPLHEKTTAIYLAFFNEEENRQKSLLKSLKKTGVLD